MNQILPLCGERWISVLLRSDSLVFSACSHPYLGKGYGHQFNCTQLIQLMKLELFGSLLTSENLTKGGWRDEYSGIFFFIYRETLCRHETINKPSHDSTFFFFFPLGIILADVSRNSLQGKVRTVWPPRVLHWAVTILPLQLLPNWWGFLRRRKGILL